ncbi:mRNA export factor GLE1 [Erysiphe necator]|nr:mRNA export factor GLE1 [Erysiphe necator]
MNVSQKYNDKFHFQFTGNENSSIVHELSTSFTFRNSEDLHNILLSAAQIEHNKVRESAINLFELERVRYDQEAFRNKIREDEERARLEKEKAIEAKKNQESLEIVKRPPTPPPSAPALPLDKNNASTLLSPNASATQQLPLPTRPMNSFPDRLTTQSLPTGTFSIPKSFESSSIDMLNSSPFSTKTTSSFSHQPITALPKVDTKSGISQTALSNTPFSTVRQQSNEPFSSQPIKSSDRAPLGPTQEHNPTVAASDPSTIHDQHFVKQSLRFEKLDRYYEIHRNMKNLRKSIESQVDEFGKPTSFRISCKKGRREITKVLGQLIVDSRNTAIVDKVIRQLIDSLQDKSEIVDASLFTLKNRRAISTAYLNEDGADMNSDKLPSAFIYLIGAFCKAICAQLVNEAALKPQAASPIGILAARIFSDPRFHWRGDSLIDILISKMFKICPILFGVCGDESTHEGRVRIGWRKMNGKFISDQAHFDRMSGVAAGYAAISLRDFSRTRWKNPYPPTNYWLTLSAIVNTPSKEVCSTQYVVLKSLIEHSFSRFIKFYGDMAIAALQAALVEFPKRGAENSASVGTLRTLCVSLQKDHGLVLG